VLYHSTRRAVPERSWVQSLLPTTEVEPGFSTFGGMLVPVLQLISPVCKTGTSLGPGRNKGSDCEGRTLSKQFILASTKSSALDRATGCVLPGQHSLIRVWLRKVRKDVAIA
jgi:hypothetical protein